MGKGAGYDEICASVAHSNVSVQAVNPTLSRAQPTFLQELLEELDPGVKLSFSM
jgi:hypothetical protein